MGALRLIDLARFIPTGEPFSNTCHIVWTRNEQHLRTLCGLSYEPSREMKRDHDYNTHLCSTCMSVKDGVDAKGWEIL